MTQMKLGDRRPRGRRGKFAFGANANRRDKGEKATVETPWRRDVHIFRLSINTPTTGEKVSSTLVGVPGAGFTRQIRRVAVHGGVSTTSTASNPTELNVCGVLELQLGLADGITEFAAMQSNSEAPGLWRRYVTFAQGAGAFKFWIPSGWDMVGQDIPTPGGTQFSLYAGMTLRISSIGTGTLNVAGLISTQEKEDRVYS